MQSKPARFLFNSQANESKFRSLFKDVKNAEDKTKICTRAQANRSMKTQLIMQWPVPTCQPKRSQRRIVPSVCWFSASSRPSHVTAFRNI
ncbi:hypothetical protein AV530_010240 [Patagioenas fasciata monilis]|uniref:Uncharacterized protein n=1 Tax=Patagioenas fasciata monilis TaxID=372326 RepID=A0A1V4KCX4_PATFA|nr:hypothetical protein AV530_010240 [Patagioenas fasciata monilis]